MTQLDLRMRRLAFTFAIFFGAIVPRAVLAELTVFPTRLVFEKNARAGQLELINNGPENRTYRLSLVNRRMNEIGEFSEAAVKEPDEAFADGLLRYSPRQVTLAPGASQTIRIQLRKPAGLADGEYRSHLMFSQVPDEAKPQISPEAAAGKRETQVEIRLTPLLGLSIPVIVRQGSTSVTATLANMRIESQPAGAAKGGEALSLLTMELLREGSRSLFGDLSVTSAPPGAKVREVARANGLAVYVPNARRVLRITLPSASLGPGTTLSAVFSERPESGGKPLAMAQIAIP